MKIKALLFAMFFLAGTTAVFASTTASVKEAKKVDKARPMEVPSLKKGNKDFDASCTATVSWTTPDGKTGSAKATISCTCTTQTACSIASKLVLLAVPQK